MPFVFVWFIWLSPPAPPESDTITLQSFTIYYDDVSENPGYDPEQPEPMYEDPAPLYEEPAPFPWDLSDGQPSTN